MTRLRHMWEFLIYEREYRHTVTQSNAETEAFWITWLVPVLLIGAAVFFSVLALPNVFFCSNFIFAGLALFAYIIGVIMWLPRIWFDYLKPCVLEPRVTYEKRTFQQTWDRFVADGLKINERRKREVHNQSP